MTSDHPVAIVTAAGRGIGAACARALHGRGYRVALMSPSEAAGDLAAELDGLGMRGSVTSPEDLQTLVARTHEAYGRIDAVVNNTGHAAKGAVLELTDTDWHAGVDMLLLNVVRMARAITPILEAQGRGAIVNISSFAAAEPDARFCISSTVRAALSAFTRLYATEHAARGIRMNNLLPGFVDSFPVDESIRRTIPAGRYAAVGEIGSAAAWLISDDAAYITGQNLVIDGGLVRSC